MTQKIDAEQPFQWWNRFVGTRQRVLDVNKLNVSLRRLRQEAVDADDLDVLDKVASEYIALLKIKQDVVRSRRASKQHIDEQEHEYEELFDKVAHRWKELREQKERIETVTGDTTPSDVHDFILANKYGYSDEELSLLMETIQKDYIMESFSNFTRHLPFVDEQNEKDLRNKYMHQKPQKVESLVFGKDSTAELLHNRKRRS